MDRRKNIQRKTLGSAATIPGHAIYQFSLQLWQMLHMLRRGRHEGGFLWGALLPFVLRVVAGACVGRWTGQPRMPPRERLRGVRGIGGFNPLRRPREWMRRRCGGSERRVLMRFCFLVLWGRCCVCFEGCCESMCWPRERQHEGLGGGGGFNPLRGATTGVVMRRRAATE